jgi:hypothetical protein
MKKFALTSLLAAFAVACFAQQTPRPIKFIIRKADPYMVKAMLEGQPVVSPEMSTLFGASGFPAAGQALNNFFAKGKWVVNPADNSLWFFPDPS